MIDLVVNLNSYLSVAEADDLLGTSPRSALNWSTLSPTDKAGALITAWRLLERQVWAGTKGTYLNLTSATVDEAGTGFEEQDVVELSDGIAADDAELEVAEVAAGAVETISILNAGLFTTASTSPNVPTIVAPSIGSGLILDLETSAQACAWPRSGVFDSYGAAVPSDSIPADIKLAQAQLAYELSVNPAIETARDANTNLRSVKVGSVGFDYFAPTTDAGRFPSNVQELIAQYLRSATAASDAVGGPGFGATGTGASSDLAAGKFGLSSPIV